MLKITAMKTILTTITRITFTVTLLMALLSSGCKKAEAPAADSAQLLQQAFESAPAQIKQSVETVVTNLKAKNYTEATKALEPVSLSSNLTEPQQVAVLTTIQEIAAAAANDPKHDSPEMAALRAKMFMSLRRGPR